MTTTVTLAQLTEPVRTWSPSREPDSVFDYIDLSAIDNRTKVIVSTTRVLGADAPSRARQLVATGDVLVSTVRPSLNAVAVVLPELDGATASTGFTVLRPTAELDSRFLFHWVQAASFIGEMVRKATGASYPAVSEKVIKRSGIPSMPLPEQRRIAAILDQADAIRAKRRQVLAHLDDLTRATFDAMFGDTSRLPRKAFHEVVTHLEGGKSLVADDPQAITVNRVLKISSVTTNNFRPAESKPFPDEYAPPVAHFVRRGDLLISRANTTELVGAVALVNVDVENLVLPDKLWRFVWRDPKTVEPVYVWMLLQIPSMRRALSSRSSGTGGSMKNISKAKLRDMPLPWPEVGMQREFADRVAVIAAQRAVVERALAADDELFASLQSRAFRGDL